MRIDFSRKKLLGIALLEDLLIIFFLLTLLASFLEILLPGALSEKVPLAFLFTALALLLSFYLTLMKRERLAILQHDFSFPSLFILGLLLVVITLFMNRAFGIWGSLVQCALMVAAFFYYWFPTKKNR